MKAENRSESEGNGTTSITNFSLPTMTGGGIMAHFGQGLGGSFWARADARAQLPDARRARGDGKGDDETTDSISKRLF